MKKDMQDLPLKSSLIIAILEQDLLLREYKMSIAHILSFAAQSSMRISLIVKDAL